MKNKMFLILILYSLLKFEALGQPQIWLNVGVNYSNLDSRLFRSHIDGYNFTFHPQLGLAIEYRINDLILKSGIALTQRGSKFETGAIIFPDKYFIVTYTYLELPLLISYFFDQTNLGIQGGIVMQKRIETNSVEYGERNYVYGADIRLGAFWRPFDKVQFDFNYTMGNFDKIVFNIRENYVHQVFTFGLSYRLFKF